MDRIFYWCRGQDDNIGDVVLRRNLLNRLRHLGELHVYIGPASEGFTEALELGDEAVRYRSKRQWIAAIARRSRRAAIVFDPGEYRLDKQARTAHAALVPLQLLVKVRGGASVRSGIAVNTDWSPVPYAAQLFALSNRLSDVVTWRDLETPRQFSGGVLGCDWAFDSYDPDVWSGGSRSNLAIACRGDRPLWNRRIIDGVSKFCSESGLDPVVYVQVRRDNGIAASLASALDCKLVDWPVEVPHKAQEVVVREVLRRSVGVVSDRLHSLIMGINEGCVPVGISQFDDLKLRTHLAAVGLGNHSAVIADADTDDVATHVSSLLTRRGEVADQALVAKRAADECGRRIDLACV